jgi:hypothetical protein
LHVIPESLEQGIQRFGKSENDMKIIAFGQYIFYVPYPQFPVGILAFGAMPVATGIIADMFMPAMAAMFYVTAQDCCPAMAYCLQYPLLIPVGMISLYKRIAKPTNHLRQFKPRLHQDKEYNLSKGEKACTYAGLIT